MSGREVVLRRIRDGLGRPADVGGSAVGDALQALWEAAAHRERGDLQPDALRDLFAARASEYRVQVRRLAKSDVGAAVAAELKAHGASRAAAPADLPEAWCAADIAWLRDGVDGVLLSTAEIDGCQAVVTGCAWAVAETGSLVFDGGPQQGRRLLTLLPDLHVCVVREEQVVQTVPEAVAATGEAARRGAPVTLVSGPSATSDIELDRVEGVHGPRTLVVLLAG